MCDRIGYGSTAIAQHSMDQRRFSACFVAVFVTLVVAAAGLALGATSTPTIAAGKAADKPPLLQVVLLNGGGQPASNYQSHLLHIKQFSGVLRRAGIPSTDIVIFSADGADPAADLASRERQPEMDFWLLQGTHLDGPLRTQTRYENSQVDGFDLQPATSAALRGWFAQAARRLQPGDTLLFYVTDHGTKNAEDLSNNRITLWGKNESLSVAELRRLLALLDPGVRVVTLMSQCYSGAFANLMHTSAGQPAGNVCGFFSSTADRQAYGCYPENRDKDNVGHAFRFIESLAAGHSFPEAHNLVLVSDSTPDVPLKTSDVYLTERLEAEAQRRGQTLEALVDELLALAWQNPQAWEPETRLLDRIGQAYGYFSPRTMAELREQAQFLPDIGERFRTYGESWKAALLALAAENLKRFLARQPDWQKRVSKQALATLDAAERRALTQALLKQLAAFTQANPAISERLHFLKDRAERAAEAHYRMQVRLGVVLRLRAILTRIAGRVYMTQGGTSGQRQAYAGLESCEALALPPAHRTDKHTCAGRAVSLL